MIGTGKLRRAGPRLRRLASDEEVEILYTRKAQGTLLEEGISRPDAQMSLCNARVIRSEGRHAQWRLTIRGQDAEGECIELIVAIDPDFQKRIVILAGKRVTET